MRKKVPDFPDINVWIALSLSGHTHHQRAKEYWKSEAASNLLFCRTSAMGFIRVCSNIEIEGIRVSPQDAWALWKSWLSHSDVRMIGEPTGINAILDGWVSQNLITRTMWSDAYLAAFAASGKLRLVTFDRDFERFSGLDSLILT